MGLVAILCPSVGQALNTSRLVVRRDYEVVNGDYNILLLFFGGIGTTVSLFVAKDSMTSVPVVLWTVVLLMTTIFRYYGDVEYRLNLKLQEIFLLLRRAYRRVCGGVRRLSGHEELVSGLRHRRGGQPCISCRDGNSVSRLFPQKPMVREGAGAGRISGVLLSDHQPYPEYRQAGAGAYDRASCGDPVLCHVPDRKNSGAAGGAREHDPHFLSHPETGENGPEAVPCVLPGSGLA